MRRSVRAKAVAAAIKPVYTAANAEAALAALDEFSASELGKKNPTVTRVFDRASGLRTWARIVR